MTRPITIEQPAGSLLRKCTMMLAGQKFSPSDVYDEDPAIADLAVQQIFSDEPRIWMLPTEVVRDVRVLPALERQFGSTAVATLDPRIATEITLFSQHLAKAEATAKQRRAPIAPRQNAGLVVTIIVAAASELRRSWLSNSAVYAATAEVLGPGINAKVIRDTVEGFLKDMAWLRPELRELRLAAVVGLRRQLHDVDFKLPARYSLERYTAKRKPARKL